MKRVSIVLLVITGTILLSFAPVSTYEKAMLKQISSLYQAGTVEELKEVINAFDRIAQKETNKWEPLYYAAYGYVITAIKQQEGDQKDKSLDLALENTKKALQIDPQEDELYALEGFIHMIRVTIDPAARGQQYSGLSMQQLNKAIAMDGNNPRALYLLGQMEMGTARFFGSDIAPACSKITKSLELFDAEDHENALHPSWGKRQAEAVAEHCSK